MTYYKDENGKIYKGVEINKDSQKDALNKQIILLEGIKSLTNQQAGIIASIWNANRGTSNFNFTQFCQDIIDKNTAEVSDIDKIK